MTVKNRVVKVIFRVYLEIIRIMPQLVLLFIVYFGTTRALGWNLSGEVASVIVFVLWGTAEMGDLVRGALISIPKHQFESSEALGLTKRQTYIYIIMLKVAQQIIEANRMTSPNAAFGVFLIVFILYFLVCWPISMLARYLEKKWNIA